MLDSIIFFLSFWTRVDFFIPGLATVGGFSICSSPRELKESSTIELAVKHSQHPPALWVHTKVCIYNMSSRAQVYFVCFNPLTPGDFWQKHIFLDVLDIVSAWISAKVAPVYLRRHLQQLTACLSFP